jgi:hypothetical protein
LTSRGSGTTALNSGTGSGQAFIAGASSVDAFEFRVRRSFAGDPTNVRVDLWAGSGFGTLASRIGTAPAQLVTSVPYTVLHWDLNATVPLTIGQTYTVRLVKEDGIASALAVSRAAGNPYAGGISFTPLGFNAVNFDLYFTTGSHTTAATSTVVPEPASIITWSLLAVGMVGGSWFHSRRKQHLAAC